MGMFDVVIVPCTSCGQDLGFQSKGGACQGNEYSVHNAPDKVMSDVNRHAPVKCPKCGSSFAILEAWNGTARYWVVPWANQMVENQKRGLVPGYMGLQDPTRRGTN